MSKFNVHFHVFRQGVCPQGWKVTLVALDCFFSTVQCALSNVSSHNLIQRKHSHIGCICLAFLHCVVSKGSSNCIPQKIHNYTDCICLIFLHSDCVFKMFLSNRMHKKMVVFVWFFSAVRFQMFLEIACTKRCTVTLVTFVWPFSAVRFQMFL